MSAVLHFCSFKFVVEVLVVLQFCSLTNLEELSAVLHFCSFKYDVLPCDIPRYIFFVCRINGMLSTFLYGEFHNTCITIIAFIYKKNKCFISETAELLTPWIHIWNCRTSELLWPWIHIWNCRTAVTLNTYLKLQNCRTAVSLNTYFKLQNSRTAVTLNTYLKLQNCCDLECIFETAELLTTRQFSLYFW